MYVTSILTVGQALHEARLISCRLVLWNTPFDYWTFDFSFAISFYFDNSLLSSLICSPPQIFLLLFFWMGNFFGVQLILTMSTPACRAGTIYFCFNKLKVPVPKSMDFVSFTMFMLFIVYKIVETMFSNFRDSFSHISTKLHLVCAWNFTHKAF